MGFQNNNLDNEWTGLEPDAPRPKKGGYWAVLTLSILMLVGICSLAGFVAWQQFSARTTLTPTLVPPTAVSDSANPPDNPPVDTPDAAPTDLPLAPTATLSQPAASPSSNVDVVQVAAALTIDGSLADWPDSVAVPLPFRVFNATSWDGTEDLTAVYRLTWDATHLYVGVTVEDDIHVQTEAGNRIFRGDSLEIQFDTQRAADFGTGFSPDDFQVALSPGDFGANPPAAFRFRGTNGGQMVDAPGHSITVAAQKTGSGYVLEAAIPWQDLALTPAAGLVLGGALNANDNDSAGTAVQELMMSHVSTRTFSNPTSWGTITLK